MRGSEARTWRPPDAGPGEVALSPLPLGSIRPRGWLARQLRIQADGLTGHLDEFWPDVGRSRWFGGDAEGWERAPYWLDGVIPLAWALDDARLMEKATGYVHQIVDRQRPDGWFEPVPTEPGAKPYDMWAILLVQKVLAQFHEATGDERVFRSLEASLRALGPGLERAPLFNWGRYRWFEGLIPIYHVYARTGGSWLLDLARLLREQGTDYAALYSDDRLAHPTPRRGRWTWDKHVVNTAMAPKAAALSWRIDGRPEDRAFPDRMLAFLDRSHGQVNGMFSGDECLAGRNPVQGTELCAVVELMYSLEVLLSVFGDPAFGDRLERVAFNALPATFAPDMWAHQYDQQANQAQCTLNPDHMWTTNGPESNLYGLEPNYGCCTSNMHQGWPKLAAHLWMGTAGEGLAAVAYAPSEARFLSGDVPVAVVMDTDYPFRDTLNLTVSPERPARFPLWLRVPSWAEGATVSVNGDAPEPMDAGTFHLLEREWRGTSTVDLRFPMRPKVTRRYNLAVAVERGPLVYSLSPEERWTRINADKPHRELPHGDFEVRPASPWNYALRLDPDDPSAGLEFEERPVGERPFSPEGAGMTARVRGRRLPGWKLRHGWADEAPVGPQISEEPLEDLILIPYGCTNIRISEFPQLEVTSTRSSQSTRGGT
ncbi:MAG: glycoside hydrolase family 127 protein [Acidobacteriota bacterium]